MHRVVHHNVSSWKDGEYPFFFIWRTYDGIIPKLLIISFNQETDSAYLKRTLYFTVLYSFLNYKREYVINGFIDCEMHVMKKNDS